MRYLAQATAQLRSLCVVTAAACLLLSCEAPLDLSGVEQELASPIHRYDQFQAAASKGSDVVVVGNSGAVLVSGDEGTSWRRQELSGRPTLIDVALCPDGRFAALDALRNVWLSDEEAANWQQYPIETTEAVMALTCDGQNRLWVVASFSTILSSEDAAETWTEDSLGEDAQLTSVQFVDDDVAYITGEFGMVLKSTDSGASWERVADLPGEMYPQAAHFADETHGWVVGLNGAILHTADGAASWHYQDSGVSVPLYGISGAKSSLYAVGENGVMLHRLGQSWQALPHNNNILSYLRAVQATGDRLIAGGGNGVLLAIDTNGEGSK